VKAARPANVLALVVALVWVWAFAMPAAQKHLPPEVKDYLNGPSDTSPASTELRIYRGIGLGCRHGGLEVRDRPQAMAGRTSHRDQCSQSENSRS
jgi:hypothetical protein